MLTRAVGQPEKRIGVPGRLGVDDQLTCADYYDVGDLGVRDRDSGDRHGGGERIGPSNGEIHARDRVGLNGCDGRRGLGMGRTGGCEGDQPKSGVNGAQLGGDSQTDLQNEVSISSSFSWGRVSLSVSLWCRTSPELPFHSGTRARPPNPAEEAAVADALR